MFIILIINGKRNSFAILPSDDCCLSKLPCVHDRNKIFCDIRPSRSAKTLRLQEVFAAQLHCMYSFTARGLCCQFCLFSPVVFLASLGWRERYISKVTCCADVI